MSSCSSQKTKEGLRKRITRYWDSRIAGDWKACYDFYIADQKTNLPFNDFLRVREGEVRMKIDSYEIQSVEVNGDKGESHVKFVWKIELPVHIKDRTKSGSGELTQQWLYENGDWFYQPKSDSQP